MVTCKAARKVWQLSSMVNASQQMRNANLLGDLMMLQKKLSKAELELVASMWWVIWHAQNKFVSEGVKLDQGLQMAKAEAVNEVFKRTKFPEMLNLGKMQKEKPKSWTPPPDGWLKINVNATTDTKRQCSGLGAIIIDSTRKCLAVAIKTSRFGRDVTYVEVEAAEQGIKIAQEAGLQSVILETDSHEVPELINNREGSLTEIYLVLAEIQDLKKNFKAFKAQYVPRSFNECAQSLTKMAIEKFESIVWVENFPPEIL